MRLRLKPQALRDLRSITLYIAKQNRDFVIADRFAQRLVECCGGLLKAPRAGTPYEERSDVRKIVEGNYKIFYRVQGDMIDILRIWDGRRGHDPIL